ncbi:MAG TPA: efflux RND transporter periplasmic adaptor subunit [Steroidobacteraceae bacterium]|nr:efflux RND transporter periplasmic adaptor subunit [Steroidobacteraceae bacterium]
MRLAVAAGSCAAMLIFRCVAAHAQTAPTLTVRAQPVTETFQAYGQIQPVALTQVSAVEAGIVSRLVLPGERVTAGQVLAVLGGVQAQSLLLQRRGALRAASVQLAADRRKLAAHLVTRQTVAADEAAYETARGQLQVALGTLTLRAPADGQVIGVEAANGSRVAAGQLILTLQTSRPWLQATYYGAEALAIHPGMTGQFQPPSGAPIPVRVKTVSQALGADGGEQVGLFPELPLGSGPAAAAASWRSGQWGTVTLLGATRPMIAVPTRAVILDRARWWVLVRTPGGDRQQQVVPGPASDWTTYISQGLSPGEQVVVANAYLEFHRGIGQRYAAPD